MLGHSIFGQGPQRLMFLHGWFDDARIFDPLKAALDPSLVTAAFVDFPGYGASKNLEGPYTIPRAASAALSLADELGWDEFAVIGHSMGAKAGGMMAAGAPEQVTALVGVTPVWLGKIPFPPALLTTFHAAPKSLDARKAIITGSTGNRLPPYWVGKLAETSMEVIREDAYASYFESWAFEDHSALARSIQQKVLVVAGAYDQMPAEFLRGTWVKSLPNASFKVMPESGHWPMQECPLLLAQIIMDFLK